MSPQVVYFGISEVLTLSREGIWLSNGEEITHAATVQAFFRHLRPSDAGGWCIQIGKEEKPVSITDTPSFVRAVSGSPDLGFRIHLLGSEHDSSEPLQPGTLQYLPGRLTCRTERGWEARFLRSAYHALLQHLMQDSQGYYLKIKGVRIDLSSLTPSDSYP